MQWLHGPTGWYDTIDPMLQAGVWALQTLWCQVHNGQVASKRAQAAEPEGGAKKGVGGRRLHVTRNSRTGILENRKVKRRRRRQGVKEAGGRGMG